MLFSDPSVGVADPLLRRAYRAAERGRGTVSPNPLVGCVIARDGVVVAEGFHERAGGPHAEAVALLEAGAAAAGSDVYVTLEPCNHHGRTPPCTEALVRAGVASVTIGMTDPDRSVSGGGARALEAAGIGVRWAEDARPFEAQNEAWLRRLATGRPFVRAKVALTIDGRPALADGVRAAITGPGGRAITAELRRRATAVLVGARTLEVDDPRLTVRSVDDTPASRQPVRVIACRGSIPGMRAGIFSDGAGPVIVVCDETGDERRSEALAARGVTVLRYDRAGGVPAMLRVLASHGIDDVLAETGPGLFTALWDAGVIDELIVLTAGGVAGPGAPAAYLGAGHGDPRSLVGRMRAVEAAVSGDDAVVVWRPRERDERDSRKECE